MLRRQYQTHVELYPIHLTLLKDESDELHTRSDLAAASTLVNSSELEEDEGDKDPEIIWISKYYHGIFNLDYSPQSTHDSLTSQSVEIGIAIMSMTTLI